MAAIGPPNSRPSALVDPAGRAVADPLKFIVGRNKPFWGERLVYCSSLNSPEGVSRRYQPSHPPGEVCEFGLDFSFVIPYGVGIQSGTLGVFTNLANPASSTDFTLGAVEPRGRALYANVAGGVDGTDYQFRWTAYDNQGNIWPRTVLLLCGLAS